MKVKYISRICILAIAGVCASSLAQEGNSPVSADKANALGDTLTRFGAERAGNEDGSIPPYTGGLDPLPEYDRDNMDRYINPYRNERPLYTITRENMSDYEDLLTEGTKGILQKYPTYNVHVYETHRSVRYPEWVLQNTVKNATTARMAGEVRGDAIVGEGPNQQPYPGVPFPIPQNGYEVMWNHKLSFGPAVIHEHVNSRLVDSRGGVSNLPSPYQYIIRPWYDQSGWLRDHAYNAIFGFYSRQTAPPRAAGITFLNFYLASADQQGGQLVWFYTPGQRRARRAPDFAYDLPISAYGGVLLWDEIFGFVGRKDRYNFRLVGKEERIVPANSFRFAQETTSQEAIGRDHINSDTLRFEKRRVWIVEAERKADARHVYKTRRFYIDEDSWNMVAADTYDDADRLWKSVQLHTFPAYDVGGVNNTTWIYDDLIAGNYMVIGLGAADSGSWSKSISDPDEIRRLRIPVTPREVEAAGVR